MGLKWLITGGCGFIGTNLVEQLLRDGDNRIRVLDNLSVGNREDLSDVASFVEWNPAADSSGLAKGEQSAPARSPLRGERMNRAVRPDSRVELVVGDILDKELVSRVSEGMDVIVHLAANTGVGPSVEKPFEDCMTNVIGSLNLLEAARHNAVKRFVFASSGASVGEVEPPIHERLSPHPVSPYGAGKLAGEGYCSAYSRTFGLETVALRFSNVYGPRSKRKNSVVAKFIRQVLKGETLEVYGDGRQTRDFLYVDDLVRAVEIAAMVPGVGGEVFQIATNIETSVEELAETLLATLADAGMESPQIQHSVPRPGDVRRNYSDTSKARKLLGWHADTPLLDGLRRTVSSMIITDHA